MCSFFCLPKKVTPPIRNSAAHRSLIQPFCVLVVLMIFNRKRWGRERLAYSVLAQIERAVLWIFKNRSACCQGIIRPWIYLSRFFLFIISCAFTIKNIV